MLSVQRLPAETASAAAAEVSCESARAFFSCPGSWHLPAQLVFAPVENCGVLLAARPRAVESPAPPRGESLQAPQAPCRAIDAPTPFLLDRPPCAPLRFAGKLPFPPGNGSSRNAPAA